MRASDQKDTLAIGLLIVGVGLSVLEAFLPVIQFNSSSGVLTMTSWQVLPWFTKLKFLALAMLLAAAFLPQLHKWRMLIAAAAVIMVFVPAISSFISALYAWGTVRADIVRLSGTRNPFVNPGIANAVLVVGALAISYAVWRLETLNQPASEKEAAPITA